MRWLRRALHATWIALLLTLPWTGLYTSVGVDVERVDAGVLHGTYYRLRWPGDGSIALARLDEERAAVDGEAPAVDLGAAFLQPAPELAPQTPWQQAGFWCVDADAKRGPVPAVVAGSTRAWLVGVPQWVLAVALAVPALLWQLAANRSGKRARQLAEPAARA